MNDFLEQIWWGNPVKNYLIVAGVILFVWLLKRFISLYLAGLLHKVVHKIWKNIDKKSFISLVVKPLGLFLAVLVSVVTLYKLNFPQELDADVYKYTVKQIAHCIGNIILILSFTSLLIRIIDFVAMILEKRANLTADQSDNQLIVFFKDFFKVILVIIGIMMVLRYAFGLNVGGLLTGLSIVGAAIALSLRESLENLIASFIIFFDKPFITGDVVKVLNITGAVERIGLRSTRIRTDQKTFVTVPNKQMVDSVLDNLSLRTQRKGELRLHLDQSATAKQIEQLLASIEKKLLRDEIENSSVYLNDISINSFDVVVEYYTRPTALEEFNILKQEINLAMIQTLEDHKLELAGMAMDVKVSNGKTE
ncbi:MAG: mechanosensitive ion channel family protein [Chitinophagaceae bacterium]|nr:mechanosensitive ion channel family protein [Chitinophagaceae bacterium]